MAKFCGRPLWMAPKGPYIKHVRIFADFQTLLPLCSPVLQLFKSPLIFERLFFKVKSGVKREICDLKLKVNNHDIVTLNFSVDTDNWFI